jgi:hypothetical protein
MSTLRVDNLNARTGTTISVPTGTRLYAPGAIVQRQVNYSNTQFSSSSTTMYDVITVSITPTYATSRIWLTASVHVGKRSTGELQFSHRFLRNGTTAVTQQLSSSLTSSTGAYDVFRCTGTADAAYHHHHIYYAYDEPGTTSTVTYNFQVAQPTTYQAIYFNFSNQSYSTLIAEEMGK